MPLRPSPQPSDRARPSRLLLALLALGACGEAPRAGEPAPAPERQRLEVLASVPPLADLAERIGGERVRATVLVPPGTDLHAYEPSPRQLVGLERGDLFLRLGHPGFAFEARFLDRLTTAGEGPEVISLAALPVPPPPRTSAEAAADPHLWLDPEVMRAAALAFADAAMRHDPEGRAEYTTNLAPLLAEIDRADARWRQLVAGREEPLRFLAYHPAWTSLADRYGLVQIAVESGGREPGPRTLATVIERARREEVRLVLQQRGEAAAPSRTLAEAVAGRMVELDPMAADWLATLEAARRALAEEAAGG